MKFKVSIFTPNKMLIIKGKPVRTPTETVVNKQQLEQLKTNMRANGITKYSIKPHIEMEKDLKLDEVITNEETNDKKVEVQELDPNSTLDSFLEE